jgi:hypothetical protein
MRLQIVSGLIKKQAKSKCEHANNKQNKNSKEKKKMENPRDENLCLKSKGITEHGYISLQRNFSSTFKKKAQYITVNIKSI